MALTRSLRWAGTGISNGRQRLLQTPVSVRQYSGHSQAGLRKRPVTLRQFPSSYTHISQQSRSISLFGWGSKSTDVLPETSQIEQSSNAGIDAVSSVKTVKASHGTSESPDIAQLQSHTPTSFEPEPLEKLQQAIVEPTSEGLISDTVDISNAAERIGYLREVCGLDFGWGPSSCMEWLLEHYHISLGLSWAASIAFVAITLRAFMLPAMISSAKQQAKMREAAPILTPLREQFRDATVSGDKLKAQELQMQMKHISKEYDINIMRAFVPMIIQIPFGYGAWRVLRNCGSLPVPGFVTESWLWTSDLSFSDPYLITPVLSSFTIWYTMKMNMRVGATASNQSFMQLFSTIFPVLSFVFMLFQPGSVQLYFLTSTLCGLGTAKLMQLGFFRRYFNLGPLPNSPTWKTRDANMVAAFKASGSAAAATTTAGGAAAAAGASTAAATSATSTTSPGGLRRRPSPTSQPTATPTPTASTENRSVIDKGVDTIKDTWAGLQKSATDVKEQTMGKVSTREAKAKQERFDKYEAEERARLDSERERRNQMRRKSTGR